MIPSMNSLWRRLRRLVSSASYLDARSLQHTQRALLREQQIQTAMPGPFNCRRRSRWLREGGFEAFVHHENIGLNLELSIVYVPMAGCR